MDGEKIFCVGFHKTGTKSLAAALTQLGYRVTRGFSAGDAFVGDDALLLARALVPQFDAFQDTPWPLLYKEMAGDYPSAKFILTVRPGDEWIRSVVRHFGDESTPMREWIYGAGRGSPVRNEALYVARLAEHDSEVQEYFRSTPDRLLVLRITAGDGWEKLCPFLDKPVPSAPFPHTNAAEWRERRNALR